MVDQQAMATKPFQIHQVGICLFVCQRYPIIVHPFSVPVVLAGTSAIPPATAVNYIPWALMGFIFNYVIRKRYFNWWAKYNCDYRNTSIILCER